MFESLGFRCDYLKREVCYEGIITMLLLTNPNKKREVDEINNNEMYFKGWYWVRIISVVVWLLINIWVVMLNHVN